MANVPEEIKDRILGLKKEMYTRGSIVREIKRITKDKDLATRYVNEVLEVRKNEQIADPSIYRGEGKRMIIIGAVAIPSALLLTVVFRGGLILALVGLIYLILGILKYTGIYK